MITAIILDMDGVMIDSMPLYCKAYNEILAPYGKHIALEEFSAICAGLPFLKIMALLGVTDNPEALLQQKEDKIRNLFTSTIKPIPGIYDLLKLPLKFAIASGSSKEIITMTVEKLSISDKISAISSGYEVANPKPAPDVWLDAAKKLLVEPSECIIIEDGRAGVAGAKEAGMITIGLVSNMSIDLGADYHVTSLSDAKKIIEDIMKR